MQQSSLFLRVCNELRDVGHSAHQRTVACSRFAAIYSITRSSKTVNSHVQFLGIVFLIALCLASGETCAQPVFVVYKHEHRLELWDKGSMERQWTICSLSAVAGRKMRQGDQLVPEGVYAITSYNPRSASWKTLHINYPNAFDRSQGCTGGAIGIHGKCASSGCIGMSNADMDAIVVALGTRIRRLPIPVLMFASNDSLRVERLLRLYERQGDGASVEFLRRLEKLRQFWEKEHRIPKYTWDAKGYRITE